MKETLKKALIPIFLSVFLGAICGKLVYKIYLGNNDLVFQSNLIYLIESGTYDSYDNMRADTIGNNYIYYEDDNLYKAVIGVTKKEENIEKIKKIYNHEVTINKYYLTDIELNNKLNEYDNKLIEETDEIKIKEIIMDMLNLYKQEDNIKLTKIS